jgi:hypothetical protein
MVMFLRNCKDFIIIGFNWTGRLFFIFLEEMAEEREIAAKSPLR